MSKTLNFNKVKKNYFTVTLADENETMLMIMTPTKALLDDLVATKDALTEMKEDGNVTGEIYSMVARLMSRNKTGKHIDADTIAEIMDFEDVIIFIQGYLEFVNDIKASKN